MQIFLRLLAMLHRTKSGAAGGGRPGACSFMEELDRRDVRRPREPANSVAQSPWDRIQYEIKGFSRTVRRRSGGLYSDARGSTKKQLRSIITALVFLLLPSITQADYVTGKIALVDVAKDTIALTSGITFFVAESVSIVGLIPGDDIEITFGRGNGMLIAIKLSRSDGEARLSGQTAKSHSVAAEQRRAMRSRRADRLATVSRE